VVQLLGEFPVGGLLRCGHLEVAARAAMTAPRHNVSTESPFGPLIGFSRAVRIGSRVVVAGTAPVWPDGSCPDDVRVQARRCWDVASAALAEAGASLRDVVRTRTYLMSSADFDAVSEIHRELFADILPAATMIVVAGMLDSRWKVEIEAEAVITG
jgi:enamine deaminase RidA (YjgF/YER057c/UK114 family)